MSRVQPPAATPVQDANGTKTPALGTCCPMACWSVDVKRGVGEVAFIEAGHSLSSLQTFDSRGVVNYVVFNNRIRAPAWLPGCVLLTAHSPGRCPSQPP